MNQSPGYSVYAVALTGVALGLAVFILYKISSASDDDDKNNPSGSSGNKMRKREHEYSSRDQSNSSTLSNSGETHPRNVQRYASSSSNGENTNKTHGDAGGTRQIMQATNFVGADSSTTDVVTTDGYTTLKMSVPSEMVGAIIGRQGCNVKQIQSETNTKIDFGKQQSEDDERIITIRGSEKGTQDAELKILHIVVGQQSKQTHTIQVPQGSLGFIIGKGGESIKKIQSDSQCKVKVGSSNSSAPDPNALAEIRLTGSDVEILSAVTMIEALVVEWDTKKNRARFVREQAGPRRPSSRRTAPAAIAPGSPLVCESWPNHSDYVDCYVTATVDPTHLWLQLLTPSTAGLEDINSRLCHMYSDSSEFVDDVVTKRPPIGTTVAARNITDDAWYRGKVSEYNDDDGEPSVDIYFVDYGDSNWMPLNNSNVQLLRPEFYSLPALAIECFTDLISHPDCLSEWSTEHCDVFDKIAHTGEWNVLVGAMVEYRAREEGSSELLPVIKLVDTNTEVDIHITAEIVKYVKSNKVGFGDLSGCPRPTTNGAASAASAPVATPEVLALGSARITLADHTTADSNEDTSSDTLPTVVDTTMNTEGGVQDSPGSQHSSDECWD